MKDTLKENGTSPKSAIVNYLTGIPGSIVIGCLLISLAMLVSGGVIKPKGTALTQTTTPTTPTTDIAAAPTDNPGPYKVSADDDPVLGDANAPVTLIEFSDYECPFCKRHFDETYPQLKEEYIDTGKVKLVFRDNPLTFHEPNASEQAVATNCAREQGGDTAYFKLHDIIFDTTTSNKGLPKTKLPELATQAGLNVPAFNTCLDSKKFDAEIKKDIADATAVGASGTPTFFIGKSTDGGEIDGMRLIGAYPYDNFKTLIDQALAE